MIVTLQGIFKFKIRTKYCPHHNPQIILKTDLLDKLSPEGRKYGIDVLLAIGFLRWGLCIQRDQIRVFLKQRGIQISTGMISYLSFDFLLFTKQIFQQSRDILKTRFLELGGMVIHIDATDEKGGNAVLQIKEGRTGITLHADSIVSEREEYITPILKDFKEQLGKPIAIVTDMGSAVLGGCNSVFPDTPKQLCHYHFIRALGNKLFEDVYDNFKKRIFKTELTKNLSIIRKNARRNLKSSNEFYFVRHSLYWLHILIDHIVYTLRKLGTFPFRLAYLDLYDRTVETSKIVTLENYTMGGALLPTREFYSFRDNIHSFVKDTKLRDLAKQLRILGTWFTSIRTTMRLLRNDLKEQRPLDQNDIKEMKDRLIDTINNIREEGEEMGGIFAIKSKMISKDFEKRWDGLFIDVWDENGNYIPIRRDNNIDERAHRWIRMGIRRRTGKSRTQMEMYQLGSLLAYFSNLLNEEYRKIVCSKIGNPHFVFSKLDWKIISKERKQLFLQTDGLNIPLRDEKREKLILDYYLNAIKKTSGNDEYMKNWLTTMNDLIDSWHIDFEDTQEDPLDMLNPTGY